MGDTSIEWTDATWNPVTGCTKVSAGCKHCYAERIFPRAYSKLCVCGHEDTLHGYPDSGSRACATFTDECREFKQRKFADVQCHPDRLEQPLHWKKPRKVFVNSMSDLFHEDVPFEFIDKVFAVMALTPQHTYQILTKRPERMREYLSDQNVTVRWMMVLRALTQGISGCSTTLIENDDGLEGGVLGNVWLGVSCEDQKTADERIPRLLQTPAAVRFVSYEPALSGVNFLRMKVGGPESLYRANALTGDGFDGVGLDWIIAGSESGPKARPAELDWYRSVRDQCAAAGVAFFLKQHTVNRETISLPELDGRQYAEFPKVEVMHAR